jgi:hypothetical protein
MKNETKADPVLRSESEAAHDQALRDNKYGLSFGAISLFHEYAEDAGNWSGTPLVGGNVDSSPRNNGYLLKLKLAGLITTQEDEGRIWLSFTPKGKELALDYGIEV